jgi:hypothetical protein
MKKNPLVPSALKEKEKIVSYKEAQARGNIFQVIETWKNYSSFEGTEEEIKEKQSSMVASWIEGSLDLIIPK